MLVLSRYTNDEERFAFQAVLGWLTTVCKRDTDLKTLHSVLCK